MNCFLKIHSQQNNQVIGVCDENCINLHLKQGKFNFHVSEAFFKDRLVSIEEAIKILKLSPNFNAVGKYIIQSLIQTEIIHPDGIIEIEGIPIAMRLIF